MLGGQPSHRLSWLVAGSFPGFLFVCLIVVNMVYWRRGSSSAIPASTLLVIVILWALCCVPTVFGGAFIGFKSPAMKLPVRGLTCCLLSGRAGVPVCPSPLACHLWVMLSVSNERYMCTCVHPVSR